MNWTGEPARVLDFDCETRPGFWLGGDYVTKGLTAIAWSFIDSGAIDSEVLRKDDNDLTRILEPFLEAYDQADIVTGHFIRGFDLPVLNGALEREGMAPLSDKMTSDTKLDHMKTSGMSNSQENLGITYELEHPKVPMSEPLWVEFTWYQTDRSREWVRERVEGDVLQHMDLRAALIAKGWLGSPKKWTATPAGGTKYHA